MSRHLFLLLLLVLAPAMAAAREPRDLSYDLRLDLPLTVLGTGLWIASHPLESVLTPKRCRWCDDNAFDASARDALRWAHPLRAGRASDILVSGVIPALSFGGLALARVADTRDFRDSWLDPLFVLEAASVAVVLNQAIKFAVARERPFAHYDAYAGQKRGSFERLSFYSSHSNLAFALASSAGMVASLRGYRAAPIVWSVGMAAATFVAYARVAGDYHYLSDVLVGGAVGSLVGAGLPWLLHRPRQTKRLQVSAGAGSILVSFQH